MTRERDFGSKCELSDSFLKKIASSPIVEQVVESVEARQQMQLKRALGTGTKKKRLNIPKLEDANLAGGPQGHLCTLILTEGDSAKALAMSGIQIVGRDRYGVFPLKGKLLNVRDSSKTVLLNNEEIQNLIKIMGFYMDRVYKDVKDLRYGSIMIMTDQDHDGSHIKGLLINFLHFFWPSLLKLDGFLKEFITPIIKITKADSARQFFTITDFEKFVRDDLKGNLGGYKVKYYKGLGTSTSAEAKEYFKQIQKHVIKFQVPRTQENLQQDNDSINLAFNKSYADARKEWLANYSKDACIDHSKNTIGVSEFVNRELIHFSHADNQRSIPSMVDGLKPGQRKILFACFKRLNSGQKKFSNDIKVAQLSGYVAEHSAYHHGEMSLQMTIVGMAQDFVGTNNINTLSPIGQFGTRALGGKDYASARYIFTNLGVYTRLLFPEFDTPVLNYINDEGMSIEPEFYTPIMPLILVNGAEGIGTGWSTSIPQFNPLDLVWNLKRKLQGRGDFKRILPWYKGFTGDIAYNEGSNSYTFTGRYKVTDNKLEILELPIKKWTSDYKQFLMTLVDSGDIGDFQEQHKDNQIHFIIKVPDIKAIQKADGGIVKKFKLSTQISANNMVLFDSQHKIKRYSNECEILSDYFPIRLEFYKKRKAHQLRVLRKELVILENKQDFILKVNDGSIILRDKTKTQISDQLQYLGFQKDSDADNDFDYLLQMPLYSLTKEKVEELRAKVQKKQYEIQKLEGRTIEQIWVEELEIFEEAYKKELKNLGISTDSKSSSMPDYIPSYGNEQRGKVLTQISPNKQKPSEKSVAGKDSSEKESKQKLVSTHRQVTKQNIVKPATNKIKERRQVKKSSSDLSDVSNPDSQDDLSEVENEVIVKRRTNSRAIPIDFPEYDPWAKTTKRLKRTGTEEDVNAIVQNNTRQKESSASKIETTGQKVELPQKDKRRVDDDQSSVFSEDVYQPEAANGPDDLSLSNSAKHDLMTNSPPIPTWKPDASAQKRDRNIFSQSAMKSHREVKMVTKLTTKMDEQLQRQQMSQRSEKEKENEEGLSLRERIAISSQNQIHSKRKPPSQKKFMAEVRQVMSLIEDQQQQMEKTENGGKPIDCEGDQSKSFDVDMLASLEEDNLDGETQLVVKRSNENNLVENKNDEDEKEVITRGKRRVIQDVIEDEDY